MHSKVGLKREPNPARRPGPEEKLTVNKISTRYYLRLNLQNNREPIAGLKMTSI